MNRREILKAGLGSLAAASAGWPMIGPAQAADWPTKSIRVVVPYAAGSATDLVPRTVFEQVGQQVGQSFIVENRPGGGTTIGSAQVKAGRAGRPHHPGSLQRHRHRAGDPAQRALRPGEGFFRPDAARQRAAGAGGRAEQGHEDAQGAGRQGQGQARRDQLRRRRHRHAAASGDGALPSGRGLRGPARAVQGRAGGADRGDDRPHRHVFLLRSRRRCR